MENRVPNALRGNTLSPREYCVNLEHLARNGIRGISFTGGEPTLSPQISELIAFAGDHFDKVEMTTNGFRVKDLLSQLTKLSLLKISLDSASADQMAHISGGDTKVLPRAIEAIHAACKAGIPVAVNMVVLHSTFSQIVDVAEICSQINRNNYPSKCHLSLLDFYFSEERRDIWQKEFLEIGKVETWLKTLYGAPKAENRIGCGFRWYDAGDVQIRIKDSGTVTLRLAECDSCKNYCQEGIYGLKHSVEGWLTTCPSNDDSLGNYLNPALSREEADRVVSKLVAKVRAARPDVASFSKLIIAHSLHNPH